MDTWSWAALAGLYGSCFGLSIVSALVPWVNGEILLLSMAALVHSPGKLFVLVVLASAGQMAGKCVLYWTARGALHSGSSRIAKKVERWRERFEGPLAKRLALVFISSAVGIPPFYIISILAGAFQLDFKSFQVVGMCGRLVRFGLIVAIPYLTLGYA